MDERAYRAQKENMSAHGMLTKQARAHEGRDNIRLGGIFKSQWPAPKLRASKCPWLNYKPTEHCAAAALG